MDILISSNNKDKIKEIRSIFNISGLNLVELDKFPDAPEVVEDGNTLYENALKKAKVIAEFTGMPTLADDTGLFVDALDGAPGVYSARFAGEDATYDDNVNKLLAEMTNVADNKRTARFQTVAVFFHPDMVLDATGTVEGRIIREKRGAGGFGYDPVFYIPAEEKTYAEIPAAEKNRISHRSLAFRNLSKKLESSLSILIPQD